tara:strand:+ start:130 stop:384 length:255 start_codon:yes stop_codon:yes gene_type:complete
MDRKRAIMTNLLIQLEHAVSSESLKQTVSNVRDTVVHTAPEILDSRWQRIFQMCTIHMNDANNPEHEKCFNLYMQALEEYKNLL